MGGKKKNTEKNTEHLTHGFFEHDEASSTPPAAPLKPSFHGGHNVSARASKSPMRWRLRRRPLRLVTLPKAAAVGLARRDAESVEDGGGGSSGRSCRGGGGGSSGCDSLSQR